MKVTYNKSIQKGSSHCFIRIRISNWYKTVGSVKSSKSKKNGLPPLPRYVGKILDTIHKRGLYDFIRMAYSQPLYEFTNRLLVILSCVSVKSSKEITFRTKQIHKRWFFISANLFFLRRDENRLLCICVFVFGLKKSQPKVVISLNKSPTNEET